MSDMGLSDIADNLGSVASALRNLGTADAATPTGALEMVAMEIKDGTQRIAEALLELAEAIREVNK